MQKIRKKMYKWWGHICGFKFKVLYKVGKIVQKVESDFSKLHFFRILEDCDFALDSVTFTHMKTTVFVVFFPKHPIKQNEHFSALMS